ncbi:DUF5994 family protein [Streptomyces sp. NPDC002499]
MSASSPRSPLRAVPFRAPIARLALKSQNRTDGPTGLDGAWWPRTRDLAGELSTLADVLDPLWGRVTRIAVNRRNWQILPPRIFVNGRVVKVGWFASERLDPNQILLLSGTAGRRDLLVVPPETDASVAARLMAAASTDTGPDTGPGPSSGPALSASALLAAEGVCGSEGPEVDAPEAGSDDWNPASQTAVAVAVALPVPGRVSDSPYGIQHPALGM